MLRYLTQIWAEEAKESPSAPLTPVLPILFYHGESPYTAFKFSQLFPADFPEELKPYHPDFSVTLFNLTTLPDAKLTGPPEMTAALWALKYARSEIEKALAALERLAKTAGDVFIKNPGFDYLKVYLLAASNRTPEEILDMINSIIHVSFLKENIMSTAEMLIKKGKLEGKQEERLMLAKKMKGNGIPLDKIVDITGLSREEIEAL
jgi:predicted transposase YdaD